MGNLSKRKSSLHIVVVFIFAMTTSAFAKGPSLLTYFKSCTPKTDFMKCDARRTKELIIAGADINERKNDDTPIVWALMHERYFDILSVLIDSGADLKSGLYGYTLLDLLVQRYIFADNEVWFDGGPSDLDQFKIALRLLTNGGLDINSHSISGDTALMKAFVEGGNKGLVRILLDAGADPSTRNSGTGQTATEIVKGQIQYLKQPQPWHNSEQDQARIAEKANFESILVLLTAAENASQYKQAVGNENQPTKPFLDFPLRCWRTDARGNCSTVQYNDGAYTVASPDPRHPGIMNSVLDHSMEKPYTPTDGYVVAFTNERRGNGVPEKSGSYPNTSDSPISVHDLYRGDSTSSYRAGLNYDGHPGYDYYAEKGAPVYAASAGTVVNYSGQRCIPKGIPAGCQAWGYLGIDHGNGFVTQYGHLSEVLKEVGDTVNSGDIIGRVGNTAPDSVSGMGAHLHFEALKAGSCGFGYCVVDPYGWEGGAGDDPLEKVTGVRNIPLWIKNSSDDTANLSNKLVQENVQGKTPVGSPRLTEAQSRPRKFGQPDKW